MTSNRGGGGVSDGQVRLLRKHVATLANNNDELMGELNRANARAGEMAEQMERMRATLSEAAVLDTVDTEAQCNLRGAGHSTLFSSSGGGGGNGGSESTKRSPPPAEFKFQPRTKKINWRQLQRLNVRRIMMNNDVTPLCQLLEELTFGDLDGESVFNLTEGNLIKLCQLAQLSLEYVNYERQVLAFQYDDFLDNRQRVLNLLQRAGVTDVEDLRDGAFKLGREFQGLAGVELENMFGQVRLEERTMARMALAGAVEETKRRVERDVEDENVEWEGSEGDYYDDDSQVSRDRRSEA